MSDLYIATLTQCVQDGPEHWKTVTRARTLNGGETVRDIELWARSVLGERACINDVVLSFNEAAAMEALK